MKPPKWITKRAPYNAINLIELTDELKLSRPLPSLGYQERQFNTCKIASNRSHKPKCHNLYLGVLTYKMLCRDSKKYLKTTEMTPLTTQAIRWTQGSLQGFTSTNANGVGTIRFLTPRPSKFRSLRIYVKGKIAAKRLNDNWLMVLPHHWCPNKSNHAQREIE